MSREAMQQALEALDNSIIVPEFFTLWAKYQEALKNKDKAIFALRQALEQPAVDPCKDGSCDCCWTHLDEPKFEECNVCGDMLRVVPRECVSLTDEELEQLAKWADEHGQDEWHLEYGRAIEAKLKEKNT